MIRRANKNRLLALAAVVVAAVLLLTGIFLPLGGWFQRLTSLAAAPFHSAGGAVFELFRNRAQLDADQAYQARIDALTAENSRLKSLAAENESLKSALDFRDAYGDITIAARVIYESDDGISRSLILNRGQADGLAVGQPVIAGDGVIVGKISAVRRRTAAVMPLTDSRSRLAVTVQNSQETIGVLEGERGLSLAIKLIPQTEALDVGQTVITSGLEPGIRRGLIAGTVDRIDRPPREPFQSASVAQFASWKRPLFVMVIVSSEGGGLE